MPQGTGSGKGPEAAAKAGALFEALEHHFSSGLPGAGLGSAALQPRRRGPGRHSGRRAAPSGRRPGRAPGVPALPAPARGGRAAGARLPVLPRLSLGEYAATRAAWGDIYGYRHVGRYATNNGWAAGTTRTEAAVHALNEIIERDAMSLLLISQFLRPDGAPAGHRPGHAARRASRPARGGPGTYRPVGVAAGDDHGPGRTRPMSPPSPVPRLGSAAAAPRSPPGTRRNAHCPNWSRSTRSPPTPPSWSSRARTTHAPTRGCTAATWPTSPTGKTTWPGARSPTPQPHDPRGAPVGPPGPARLPRLHHLGPRPPPLRTPGRRQRPKSPGMKLFMLVTDGTLVLPGPAA
ncbi:YcaO-like family protein [Streptomyces sp. CA-250714]|uniref:YcaO-like family protein n=1 Tax=Streptomyces sp. CA-250714 TaxID=3240060 RepID=UPI003D8CC657